MAMLFFKKNKQTTVLERVPVHVAFIMDGNGRWAKKRGMPRLYGHNAGTETLKKVVKESKRLGVKYITFYAFSTENWKRPEEEVSGLMQILVKFIQSEIDEINANNVKITILGDIEMLPKASKDAVTYAIEETVHNDGLYFNIALNYGGRGEIVNAVKQISKKVKEGELELASIDEACISEHLYTKNMPDPDVMIRTSGEKRLSNFLLWQLAYSEFVFLDLFWPDFTEEVYRNALKEYDQRHRRFGAI
jgi:undecaprenyl diphosphate synthase